MGTAALNGAFVGLVYGLFAVGLVVVYRASRTLNFAHGEIGMLGAFVFVELHVDHGWPLLLAFVCGPLASAAIGAAADLLLVRPLLGRERLNLLVATTGLAAFLLVFASRRYGLSIRFVEPLLAGKGVTLAGLTIVPGQVFILAVSLTVVVALTVLYEHTDYGLRLRATATDHYAAGQVGVNTNVVSMVSWGLAGMIAGISAILIAPSVAFNVFFMTGFMVRGVAAALLGGLTSVTGAFVAGIVLGVGESMISYFINSPGIPEVTLALLVLGLLSVRPTGLFKAEY
jgi:branched-chain amino acid transport system permease protein